MVDSYKLYNFGYNKFDAGLNLAIDEALFLNLKINEFVVRTYEFASEAVILGRNDNISNILNFEENKNKITITRRESGGMPIFVGNETFSFSIIGRTTIFENNISDNKNISSAIEQNKFFDQHEPHQFLKPTELHKLLGPAIANSINNILKNQIQVEVGDKYSIKLNGAPISGQSSKIEDGKFLYHGVITIKPLDADKIKSLIKLRDGDYEKLQSLPALVNLIREDDIEEIEEIKKKLTKEEFIKEQLKYEIPTEISNILKIKLIDYEEDKIKEIMKSANNINKEKYQNLEWIENKDEGLDGRGYCLLYDG